MLMPSTEPSTTHPPSQAWPGWLSCSLLLPEGAGTLALSWPRRAQILRLGAAPPRSKSPPTKAQTRPWAASEAAAAWVGGHGAQGWRSAAGHRLRLAG